MEFLILNSLPEALTWIKFIYSIWYGNRENHFKVLFQEFACTKYLQIEGMLFICYILTSFYSLRK